MRLCFLLSFLFVSATFSQLAAQDQETAHDPSHAHNDGFMQSAMHHSIAKGVALNVKTDSTSHAFTLRVGPMNLPANTSHMKMPQPPDLVWSIPITGWLLAYHPKLVDDAGNSVPGTVLHHVAFWNENRSDFLCPNKEEHIFGAGGELTDWALIPGFGYRVEKGDRIRIETMIHNPTAIAYDKAYLEITIPYLDDASPAPVKTFYPAWMDVAACGSSSYDLQLGPSKKTGSVTVKFPGVLLGVGGHMHDYGQQLTLELSSAAKPELSNTEGFKTEVATSEASSAKISKAEVSKLEASKPEDSTGTVPGEKKDETTNEKKLVALLKAKTDAQGHLLSIPVVTFFQTGGYRFAAGDKLTVTSDYNNPTGKLLHDGAMGIVVGYFVPQDPAALDSLRHAAVSPTDSHDLPHHNMSPDH
jgi:hypothetical protein